MRAHARTITAACLLLCGCAPGLMQPEPSVRGLDEGKIFVQRRKDSPQSDVYKVTYVVPTPPEAAWEAAGTVSEWLRSAARIDEVTALPPVELPDDKIEQQMEIRWSDGNRQKMLLERIKGKGLIDLQVDPSDRTEGDMAHVTVQMDPYRRNSTLVEVEVRVASSFSRRLWQFVLLPIGWIARGAMDEEIKQFCVHMAGRHREASLEGLADRGPATGRTHIVTIGVNQPGGNGAWNPIEYAEQDASDVYDWATRQYPAEPGDDPVRERITGESATDAHVSKVLGRLAKGGTRVRQGDTVIFYFAGHIDAEEDILRPEQDLYLLTAKSEPGNLRATAIKKDLVLDTLRFSAASQCLFICDACFSGGMRKRWVEYRSEPEIRLRGLGPREPFLPAKAPQAKLAILAATSEHDSAIERDDLGHGVFTHAILEGLGGGADADHDDFVSLEELKGFVVDQVRSLTEKRQTPSFQYGETVNMRFRVLKPSPLKP